MTWNIIAAGTPHIFRNEYHSMHTSSTRGRSTPATWPGEGRSFFGSRKTFSSSALRKCSRMRPRPQMIQKFHWTHRSRKKIPKKIHEHVLRRGCVAQGRRT